MESFYLKKLNDLAVELSFILSDKLRFNKPGLRKVSFDNIAYSDRVELFFYYTEGSFSLPVYIIKHRFNECESEHVRQMVLEDVYRKAYYEMLHHVLFAKDSVGDMKDTFGIDINILSFATFANSGLSKIKEKNI